MPASNAQVIAFDDARKVARRCEFRNPLNGEANAPLRERDGT